MAFIRNGMHRWSIDVRMFIKLSRGKLKNINNQPRLIYNSRFPTCPNSTMLLEIDILTHLMLISILDI